MFLERLVITRICPIYNYVVIRPLIYIFQKLISVLKKV